MLQKYILNFFYTGIPITRTNPWPQQLLNFTSLTRYNDLTYGSCEIIPIYIAF
jgi:hypothetical protein